MQLWLVCYVRRLQNWLHRCMIWMKMTWDSSHRLQNRYLWPSFAKKSIWLEFQVKKFRETHYSCDEWMMKKWQTKNGYNYVYCIRYSALDNRNGYNYNPSRLLNAASAVSEAGRWPHSYTSIYAARHPPRKSIRRDRLWHPLASTCPNPRWHTVLVDSVFSALRLLFGVYCMYDTYG